MSFIYRNYEGHEVTHGSYSQRETFNYCPRKFELGRVQGWQEREHRASMEFGKAIEAAFQFHESVGREPNAALKAFTRGWNQATKALDFKDWTYTDTEVSLSLIHI